MNCTWYVLYLFLHLSFLSNFIAVMRAVADEEENSTNIGIPGSPRYGNLPSIPKYGNVPSSPK